MSTTETMARLRTDLGPIFHSTDTRKLRTKSRDRSGIDSCRWGILRDTGNITALEVVTVEEHRG